MTALSSVDARAKHAAWLFGLAEFIIDRNDDESCPETTAGAPMTASNAELTATPASVTLGSAINKYFPGPVMDVPKNGSVWESSHDKSSPV